MNTPHRQFPLFACLCPILFLVAVMFCGCNTTVPDSAVEKPSGDGLILGFALPAWAIGDYRSDDYKQAINDLVALNSNYVSIHSTFYQDGVRGTKIYDDNLKDASAPGIEEQREAIRIAHKAGLKVMLKPHVNLRTGKGWRGDIGRRMTSAELAAWFASYDAWIVEHARLAEEEHVELFAVGTELVTMDVHADEWRKTIAKVRAVYHGPVVYCANHSTENAITWWDALDYIGIDAYYRLSNKKNPTVDELKAHWAPYLKSCAKLSRKYGKKIIFTEIGYMSTDGTSKRPYDWTFSTVYDGQEQADCYQAMFETVSGQPWFAGFFLWNWDIRDHVDGETHNGYSPKGKPAEAVVRKFFSEK